MARLPRALILLAGVMGASGVILAALSAHGGDASQLTAASSMLLLHASSVLAAAVMAERGIVHTRIGISAGFGFAAGAALFATDLVWRQYLGHRLFPFAAPAGGTLLLTSWLLVAVAAVWPRGK